MRPMPQTLSKLTLFSFILIFFALSVSSLVDDSPVMDEQNHLGRGIAYLHSGDPRLNVEHPPIVNLLAALPTSSLTLDIPFDAASWTAREPRQTFWYSFAETLFWERDNNVPLMIFLGRLPILFLTLGLGLAAYHVANRLWGQPAGLISLGALLFDPNIITNGRYITTDMGGTLFIFLATIAVIENLRWVSGSRETRQEGTNNREWVIRMMVTAIAIGCAFGAKLTSILFIPIWIGLTFFPVGKLPYGAGVLKRLLFLGTAGILSLLILWVIYGFEWGNFLFISEQLQLYNRFQGPMPTFWSGIERITLLSNAGSGRDAFLLGQFSPDGFWYYFPVAFTAKTPLVTLILFPLAAIMFLWHTDTRLHAGLLLFPALCYFLLAMNSSLNIGYRHLLPILPFLYILVAGFIKVTGDRLTVNRSLVTGYWLLLPLTLLITSLAIHPHYISFFNILYGGPENGHNVLIDSNIDWGQDLKRLEWWMFDNGVSEVNLAWYGSSNPTQLNLNHKPIPGFPRPEFLPLWWEVPFDRENPPPGVYAISVFNYWEMPLQPKDKTVYAWFREREPDDRIGYSIFIYVVE